MGSGLHWTLCEPAWPRRPSQPRRQGFRRLRRGDHRDHLELDQILPARHPLVEESAVGTLHDLVAAAEIVGDPTCHVAEVRGRQAALVAEPPVDRQRIALAKVLDDHVEHPSLPVLEAQSYWTRGRAEPGTAIESLGPENI